MVAEVTKLYYRQGTRFARGTTIDSYLEEEDCEILYDRWQDSWPEPYVFSGGIKAITAEMILEVPIKELNSALHHTRAKRILKAAKENAAR